MKKIRYAVVGLGHIAQVAVLPAFKHAHKNSELVALVSGDAKKRKVLAKKYKVEHAVDYAEFDALLQSRAVDAVYITTPNDQHRDLMVRAAAYGVHVLCEKPLAVTEKDCWNMIAAARDNNIKFMTAYRLHFEAANLEAIKQIRSGKIGEPKIFNSIFTYQIQDPKNIRLRSPEEGGGSPYDIGVYCINAARYLFRDEPIEVLATSANSGDPRFKKMDEITSVVLRFPDERLASFTTSFGAFESSDYDVLGTKGRIRLEKGYEYAGKMTLKVETKNASRTKKYPKRDQFASELVYFSDCILKNRKPEASGEEGLADVRIVEAIFESARKGRAVTLDRLHKRVRPTPRQRQSHPAVPKVKLVRVTAPSD